MDALTWTARDVVAIVEQEVYHRDRFAPAAEVRKACAAAVAADGGEIFNSCDIDLLASVVLLALPITFGPDHTPAAKADAPAAPTTKAAKTHVLRVDVVEPHRIKMTIAPNPKYQP